MVSSAQGPWDNAAYRFPVSVKAVIIRDGRVVLLRNERNEWELPGGKLELGEDPAEAVAREVREELGLIVAPERLLDLWQYHVAEGADVLIGTYVCSEVDPSRVAQLSHEHERLGWFDVDAVGALPMPDGYKRSIRAACSVGRDQD